MVILRFLFVFVVLLGHFQSSAFTIVSPPRIVSSVTTTIQPRNSPIAGMAVGSSADDIGLTVTTQATRDDGRDDQEEMVAVLAGNSRKVVRLRKSIDDIVSKSPKSIVLVGPRGSGKSSIVEELLRRLSMASASATTAGAVHRLSVEDATYHIDTVLGKSNSHMGLLDMLSDQHNATLVFTNYDAKRTTKDVDELQRRQMLYSTLASMIVNRTYYSPYEERRKPFAPRIIVTSLHAPSEWAATMDDENAFVVLNVPSLESRKADMEAIAAAKIKQMEKEYDSDSLDNVRISEEAIHRLLDHPWAGGELELDKELNKALDLLATEKRRNDPNGVPNVLRSKHMLVKTWNEKSRRRLLYEFPLLRDVVKSPWVWDHTLRYVVTPAFVVVLALLFWGPQTRDQNAALTVFWGGWWPAVMLSFPFLGRIWCSVCPFMAVGNLAQEAVTKFDVQLKKWPKWVESVGPPFAFGLFFAILMWEELWHLPQSGALSAWLLLLITSGAVFNSVQYEDRMWCRYLCPIGAMCRTFGTMSMVEVRSFKANCEGCTDPQCLKGMSPVVDPTDTFALKGCTMGLKNNQLRDMGQCTLCMSCVKNCEREVPEINLRPIGLDYGLPWLVPPAFQDKRDLALSQVETNFWMGALLTVLQGSVLAHYLPIILAKFGMDPTIVTAPPAIDAPFFTHALLAAGLMAFPGLLSLAVDKGATPLEYYLNVLSYKWGKAAESEEQQTIIETYETIVKSDMPLQETLKEFDRDGDGEIYCWEGKEAMKRLNLPQGKCQTIMGLMKKRVGDVESISIDDWLDNFQRMYVEARQPQKEQETRIRKFQNKLLTKKTFVELFDELDKDDDGFISNEDFTTFLTENKIEVSDMEKSEFFEGADRTGDGRLNLFEFMSTLRKIVRVGIQEIGYGYLPLAWACLTAYWLQTGLQEVGLALARLPNTFYIDDFFLKMPQVSASDGVVQVLQAVLVLGSLPPSIGLTQKLCNDNKIGGIRFSFHATLQVIGAWTTLYLMLSPNPLAA